MNCKIYVWKSKKLDQKQNPYSGGGGGGILFSAVHRNKPVSMSFQRILE